MMMGKGESFRSFRLADDEGTVASMESAPLQRASGVMQVSGVSKVWWKIAIPMCIVLAAIGVGVGCGLSARHNKQEFDANGFTEEMIEYNATHPFVDAEEEKEAMRAEIEEEMIQSTMEYLSTEDTDAEMYDDYADSEEIDGRRELQTDIKFHGSICPMGFPADCMSVNMDSVTSEPFTIDCGQCMQIDETSGATLDFPGGIHIKGRL